MIEVNTALISKLGVRMDLNHWFATMDSEPDFVCVDLRKQIRRHSKVAEPWVTSSLYPNG